MARALVRTGCPAEGKAAPGRQDPATHRSPRGRLGLTPPRIGEEPKKAGRSPLFRIARRCRDGLLGRCTLAFFDGLPLQPDAALLLVYHTLQLAYVTFLKLLGYLIDLTV